MSYQITYGGSTKITRYYFHRKNNKKWKKIVKNSIIVIIFVALIGIIGKFGLNVPENTAFDNLAQELAEGDNIVDAVTAFCRDIIENAKRVE